MSFMKKLGGIVKTKDFLDEGIQTRIIRELLEDGVIEKIRRGLYLLRGFEDIEEPDYVIISKVIPRGVVCLISALRFYNLTTQIPRFVYVAVPQGVKCPKIDYPSVRFFRYSKKTYQPDIEIYNYSGAEVKIYSKEKTIVDCFNHRSKIGIDVSFEALKNYWKGGNAKLDHLMGLAEVSKVEKIIKPYLEAVLNE